MHSFIHSFITGVLFYSYDIFIDNAKLLYTNLNFVVVMKCMLLFH